MKRAFLALAVVATGFLFGLASPAEAALVSGKPGPSGGAITSDFCLWANPRHEIHPTWYFWPNQCLQTPGGYLVMQTDGNLVIYDNAFQPICHSDTWGFPGAYAVFQDDGNFVIYWNGRPLKQSRTAGNYGSTLIFNVNARLLIRNAEGRKIWDFCNDGMWWV